MKRSIAMEDYYKLVFESDVQISPDGKLTAYVKHQMNKEKDGYDSDICIGRIGKNPYSLTKSIGSNDFPRWSPQGDKLAFLSTRNGKKELFLMDIKTEEVKLCVSMDYPAMFPVWSPDGSKIAFVSKVKVKEDSPVNYFNTMKMKSDPIGDYIDYSKVSHIFIYDLKEEKIKQITPDGFCLDNPEWSGVMNPSWSHDSKKLVFASKVQDGKERDIKPWKANIYILDCQTQNIEAIKDVEGPAMQPIWSRDDKSIYFIGHTNEFKRATGQKLCKIDIESKEHSIISKNLDRGLNDYTITDCGFGYSDIYPKISRGNKIYFVAGDEGKTSLFEIDTDTEEIKCTIGGHRKIYGFSISEDGSQIAICHNSASLPSQVSVYHVDEEKEVEITFDNEDLLKSIEISKQEEVVFESTDGLEVKGYVIKPVDFEDGKKYPAVLQIHGGPNLAFGWAFNFEFQLLASQGYAVMFSNPRGSRGFGQEFTYKIKDNYHKLAYDDIMTFTDKCVGLGFIDEEKMGVTGPSYGGFMTNWIMTQTNRFKAAVPQASICNWMTMFGLSDFGYMIHELLLIDPIDDLMDLWEMSPLAYVKNVETPALILHGESDMRCPLDQAEQWFVRLKSLGKEVEMITFPNSNHMMMRSGKPSYRIIRMKEIAKFFDKHLKK